MLKELEIADKRDIGAGDTKLPVTASVELAINQSSNAQDWLLSYKRLSKANKINGSVLKGAALSSKTSMTPTYPRKVVDKRLFRRGTGLRGLDFFLQQAAGDL